MPINSRDSASRPRHFPGVARFAAATLVALSAAAAAQTAPEDAPRPPPGPASQAPSENPGWLGTFGGWMQRGANTVGAGFEAMMGAIRGGAGQAAKGAADAASTAAGTASSIARDTADTVKRLPTTSIIAGRQRCTLAPNGARRSKTECCRGRTGSDATRSTSIDSGGRQ